MQPPASPPASGHLFDLSGGALCLDFANTLADRGGAQPTERLTSYAELVSFGRQAGAIDEETARRLQQGAAAKPDEASRVLGQAVALREAVYRIFAAIAAGDAAPADDLAALNAALADAGRHRRVLATPQGFEWRWEDSAHPLELVLWPIAHSAGELLTSAERSQVRTCASETCVWLFVDRSRNRSRRWCSMESCGNREKARRHYARRRSTGPT